ncbi:MAG: YraN family protein [Oscillospiraceae bacterium]|jgi:putative endonuclease|nr:YraN family protein [Oscillospiraceae bacterium]
MANPGKPIGDAGEAFAAACLEAEGYRVIARNFSVRQGEIDIIARDARYLVFVEVKARKPGSMVRPEEAVDAPKQRRLRCAAEYYLAGRPTALQPRFDVMCVEHGPDGGLRLSNWIENAF